MNNIDILEEPKDILFEIDMKLYDEFNDKFCEIEENLGTVYSYKDLEDLKKVESDTEKTLLRETISNLIAENKEKDEEIENQDKTIDRLVKEQEEREKYTHQLESENKELDKFIKEGITIATNSPYKNFQLNYLRENFIQKSKVEEIIHNNKPHIAQEKLQSLLGKE